ENEVFKTFSDSVSDFNTDSRQPGTTGNHNSKFSDSIELISVSTRTPKGPKNDTLYDEKALKILTEPTSNADNARKIKPKDQQLFNNFVKNNLEDLRTPNKTLKISTLKISTTNSLKITTPSTSKHRKTKLPPKGLPNQIIINVTKAINISTHKPPLKVKPSTKPSTKTPFKIKLTRVTTNRPHITVINNHHSTKKPKTKPTVRRIITKWSERPHLNEIKQNLYPTPSPDISSYSPPYSISDISSPLPQIPENFQNLYPNLNPEVTSHSPQYSISDVPSFLPQVPQDAQPVYPTPNPVISSHSPQYSISDVSSPLSDNPQNSPPDLSNAISTFNLNMAPDSNVKDSGGSPCPTVHISSSVLTPQQRQECSDLNLVINSHFHQNSATDRSPAAQPPNTYQAPPAEDPGVGTVEDQGTQADPGGGGGTPEAAAPAASPGGGGTGGSGGSGGSGGDGDGGGLQFPDLKGLFDLLGHLWNGLKHILQFFKNPYLYLVPMAIFFTLGFLAVFLLFPWWIPALILYAGVKSSKKSNVSFYKHVHKPLHHPDGWFWNHDTKTWQNIADYYHHRRLDEEGGRYNHIPEAIENFSKKYGGVSTQSWKWRRRRRRSATQIGESVKQLTNQLMEINATSPDIITLDTRTPPKIKQHTKKKNKVETLENSHAGVAIPINEDDVILEETTKKLSFYKIEKPTTNSGLSTWILLSGQTTPKPSRKPLVKPNGNATLMLEPNKIIKPIFKKRVTVTTTIPTTTTKLTKVKASVLNSAVSKKVTTTSIPSMNKTPPITTTPTSIVTTTINDSSTLPLEAKEGEADLNEDMKKTRRPPTKRKKNKNRRRRPSDKTDNTTKIEKQNKTKEKPIGTQLYNYLSREVMPTVGVGLVGLMVTAGLASYFLYPFGAARRSYEVDRRDKDAHYYYTDDYSGGIAEEEAIGKVIAGMPSNSLYGNTFKTPTSRHSFNNHRIIEQSTSYNVGNEEATPAAVPEHGPRRRREIPEGDDKENEIGESFDSGTTSMTTTVSSSTATISRPDKTVSIFDMFRELFHLKINLGLQLIQNATQAVSKYVSHVQKRLDQRYKNYTMV
ncbi:cell wall integrity and stress response component 3-like, partial [Asbolus verrucosus]